jgi:DNA-binding XRE family transcriptional regulator
METLFHSNEPTARVSYPGVDTNQLLLSNRYVRPGFHHTVARDGAYTSLFYVRNGWKKIHYVLKNITFNVPSACSFCAKFPILSFSAGKDQNMHFGFQAACVAVLLSVSALFSQETVSIDLENELGPATFRCSGFLNGFSGNVLPDSILLPIKVRLHRADFNAIVDSYERCKSKDSVQFGAVAEIQFSCEIPSKRPIQWTIAKHTLAEILLKKRSEKKLFQREAAKLIGVNQTTYALWEWAKTYPEPHFAEKVRKYLGEDLKLLEDRFIEFKTKIWTARQTSKMLGLNHHTFECWMNKAGRFKPRYNISGKRQIFTEQDIRELRAKLGSRIEAVKKGRMLFEWGPKRKTKIKFSISKKRTRI